MKTAKPKVVSPPAMSLPLTRDEFLQWSRYHKYWLDGLEQLKKDLAKHGVKVEGSVSCSLTIKS